MDTFPYDSWADALEAADGTTGYFTWGPGGNTASVIISLLAIAMALYWMYSFISVENKNLTEEASKLAGKYRG